MVILEPVIHQTVWCGNRIAKIMRSNIDKLGHLYLVNGHDDMSNTILAGEYKGKTLHDIFISKKSEWGMSEYDEFPLTIALVDAAKNLSIQVHPDDEIAELLENKKIGKKESWLFLEAPVDGWIYAGCECNSNDEVAQAIKEERMEEITTNYPIQKNDFVTVNAGTLHAMTSGSLVYEIEYGSDFTYRFYDYNRTDENGNRRELHVEKAMKSIDTQCVPKVVKFKENSWNSEDIYEVCRYKNIIEYKNESAMVECISILSGKGNCEGVSLEPGISIILLPGEVISNVMIEDMMITRMCK